MKRFINSVSIIFLFSYSLFSQNWEISRVADLPFATSNNAVVEGFVNGDPFVFSFGGIDSTKLYSGIHSRCFKYDLNANAWEEIAELPDPLGAKIASSASRVGDVIYIIGGYHVRPNGQEISSLKVHRYDIINDKYLEDGTNLPIAIDDQVQAVWNDSLIYVISGWSNSGNIPDVQIYDPLMDSWEEGTSVPFFSRWVFGGAGTIIKDTIYYYGGARNGSNFPASNALVKGVINPSDPTEIEWSEVKFENTMFNAYRSAATHVYNDLHWIGGSEKTYNYNGIAYDGSGGVEPSGNDLQIINFNFDTMAQESYESLPMDLRGVAKIGERSLILAGGMKSAQEVSAETIRMDWIGDINEVSNTTIHDSSIKLLPNPVLNHLTIAMVDQHHWRKLKIIDAHGTIIYSKEFRASELHLDMNGYSKGIYHILFEDANRNTSTQRFVKM